MYRTAPSVDRSKLYINSLIIRSYPNIPLPFCDKHAVPWYSDKLGVFLGPLATALNSFGGEGGREGRHSLSCFNYKSNKQCHLYDNCKVLSNLTFFVFSHGWDTFLHFIQHWMIYGLPSDSTVPKRMLRVILITERGFSKKYGAKSRAWPEVEMRF